MRQLPHLEARADSTPASTRHEQQSKAHVKMKSGEAHRNERRGVLLLGRSNKIHFKKSFTLNAACFA
jgi:hypothetical protein